MQCDALGAAPVSVSPRSTDAAACAGCLSFRSGERLNQINGRVWWVWRTLIHGMHADPRQELTHATEDAIPSSNFNMRAPPMVWPYPEWFEREALTG